MTFASRPASKENLRLRNDSSNEFLTRSNVNQQRVLHSLSSSTLVPDTQSNESHTRSDELRARSKFTTHESHTRVDELRARSRFATHGRDRQRTGDHRAQRAPQQGSEEKNSTTLRYHVCRVSALCPARNFRSRSNQTMGCAHTDVIVLKAMCNVQVWHVDGVWLKQKRIKETRKKKETRNKKQENKKTRKQEKKKKKKRKKEKKCLGCFLHCTAVLNCVRATHGLPADRAPVYRGCPCRDPLVCPLIPRQDGIRDKAPTLWLLRLIELLQLLHACARATYIGHAFTNTPPRSNTRAVDFGRFGLHCVAPYIFNLNSLEKEIFTFLATHVEPFTCNINSRSSSQSHV